MLVYFTNLKAKSSQIILIYVVRNLFFSDVFSRYSVKTLTREWVLDSITLFELQPVKDYIVDLTTANMV